MKRVSGTAIGLTEYHHYDAAGVLESITQTEAEGATGVVLDKRVDFEFNPLGQAQAIRRYASLDTSAPVAETAYDYDTAGRLTSLVHKASAAGSAGATLADYAWTYDANGRIKTFDSPDGLRDYTYDRSGKSCFRTGRSCFNKAAKAVDRHPRWW